MAETLTDPMAGYDPNSAMQPQPPAPAQPAGYEFDPRKEIDPMANKFFADTNADRNLTPEFRNRIQAQYLQGMADIQAQREKIEGERLRNTLNRQEIERSNLALAEARRKQEDAMRAAERQKGVADTLKGIRDSDLPPEEKQRQFNEAKISLAGDYVTNPTVKTIFDTVESGLPKPTEPFEVSDATKTSLIIDDGLPEWLVNSGDTELIQKAKMLSDISKKAQSDDAKQIKEARKQRTEMTLALAKEPPKFFTEENLPDTVSSKDPNRLKYLTPESQQRGRDLMLMAYGPDAVAAYNQLGSDADRYEAIREARDKVLLGLVEDLQKPEKEAATDNTVDSLLFGTKKK
jgi:succinate dehydrogenase flavin-adding protein (antitoxin of CptAB toxin-antitoxin module)